MTTSSDTHKDDTDNPAGARGDIQVIGRVAALLDCLGPVSRSIDAHQAASVLGVGRSTAHRYLASMEKAGLLQRRDAGTYEFGPALVRLGAIALARFGLVESAGPVMRELATQIAGTIVLSVWGGQAPVVVRVVPDTSRLTTVSIDVGRSLDPEAAQSRVFAAYRKRRTGADDCHEDVIEWEGSRSATPILVARHTYAEGALKAIAVPVLSADSEVLGTLATLGLRVSLPDAEDELVTERLLAGARRLQES